MSVQDWMEEHLHIGAAYTIIVGPGSLLIDASYL